MSEDRDEGWAALRDRVAALTAPGHDRDVALAIANQARSVLSQPRPFSQIDEIQVLHLLAIGCRAGEAAGYRRAVQALRDKDAEEAEAFERGTKEHPQYWDGWPYAHPYRKAAEHLESLATTDRCPRCDSPQPHLHPAVQHEGEVQVCEHPWHGAPRNEGAQT